MNDLSCRANATHHNPNLNGGLHPSHKPAGGSNYRFRPMSRFFFPSRPARFSVASRLRFDLACLRFLFDLEISSTVCNRYSSPCCGGDLPTRLIKRGYVTVGIAFSIRSI